MMKKITVIGHGTAGSLSAVHYSHFAKQQGYEVQWVYDPNIKPQAVGEGTTADVPDMLNRYMQFRWSDLEAINGNFKTGVRKIGWTKEGSDFNHVFPPPLSSMHFNANKLQQFIENKVKELYPDTKIIQANVKHSELDADYIVDCTGKPSWETGEVIEADFVYVNAVHVTQCYWPNAKFTDTLAIARPYGWVFAIPLTNRCSIGYMYNHDLNTLDEVKEDVKQIFKDWGLVPSQDTNSFHFSNYVRKQNFKDRVTYNGNASFFLEPMEATSISTIMNINNFADTRVFGKRADLDQINMWYHHLLNSQKAIINFHYMNGSIYDTPFWKIAEEKSNLFIDGMLMQDPVLVDIIKASYDNSIHNADTYKGKWYGVWPVSSFKLNFDGLRLNDYMKRKLGL
jgi:hypothetical protein